LKLRKNPECPICGEHPTITELIDYNEFCGVGRGNEEVDQLEAGEEITPIELKKLMDNGHPPVLIDVREPFEYAIANIPGAKLVPLGIVPEKLHEFDTADDIVLHCKSGKRSAEALKIFKKAGFRKLKNLTGGILAWSDQVDPKVQKY
jgi:adenylyltransferase/sulfurtransferase